jgi:hypothetical protein
LPAIAVPKDGDFVPLGKVGDDKVVVQSTKKASLAWKLLRRWPWSRRCDVAGKSSLPAMEPPMRQRDDFGAFVRNPAQHQ